ncbi:hypothetical protein [Streptomyces tendae]|uniref:hypothetical protein n=1 Tax=Streptomyces tendae TaxID=1932 RepID=UPI002491D54F|nr:hypothetical protein [Streptomyces tendae]
MVRELYLDRLGSPEHYVTPDRPDPADALVRYCGRLLQLLLWSSSLRTGLTQEEARETAEAIVGRTVHPELVQGLLGVRAPIAEQPSKTALATDVDLDRIAATVRQLLPGKPACS